MKRIFAIVVVLGTSVLGSHMLNDSKKRFFKELLKQVPYLIPRYFV